MARVYWVFWGRVLGKAAVVAATRRGFIGHPGRRRDWNRIQSSWRFLLPQLGRREHCLTKETRQATTIAWSVWFNGGKTRESLRQVDSCRGCAMGCVMVAF